MALKDITITGSIGSIATQSYGQRTYISSTDEQSFPLEQITGSQAGSWPNFTPNTNYTVGLVVNVNQSWSGSNVTPIGIVPYVHDTMEEFIDGEFSGSNYVVSDGSLIDDTCRQFLTVSTVPVNYKMFPYSSIYFSGTPSNYNLLNAFLNRNTAPRSGEFLIHVIDDLVGFSSVETSINYLKVSRYDKEGNNNTLSLQELTHFKWTDPNPTVGEVTLYVKNINEYPDYYFYEVTSKKWTESTYNVSSSFSNYNTLDYRLKASGSYYSTIPTLNTIVPIKYNDFTYNSLGSNFDATYYAPKLSTNSYLTYSSSIILRNNGPTTNVNLTYSFIEFDGLNYNVLNTTSATIADDNAAVTYNLSGTQPFIESPNFYYTTIQADGNLYIDSASLNITTSSFSPFTSSASSSVNIEPYLLSNFANSDCDVLMNNYSQNDISQYYQEVLYENGSTIPSNLQQILNRTAEPAQINDYLYNANANKLPRYSGVRTTSPNFNQNSINGLSNKELAIINLSSLLDLSPNLPSNVEQTTTYFAYFDSIKSNNPIFKGTSSPIIKYLIREDGTVFNPSTDDTTYYNLRGSFETGKNAYVNLLNDTTVTFTNTQSILISGESYAPILYTISSSTDTSAAWTTKIDFKSLDGGTFVGGNPPNYNLYVRGASYYITLAGGDTSNIFRHAPVISYDSSSGFNSTILNPTSPYFEFLTVPQTSININAIGSVYFPSNTPIGTSTVFNATLWLVRSGVSSQLASNDNTVVVPNWFNSTVYPFRVDSSINLVKTNFFPQYGDKLYVTITNKGSNTVYSEEFSNNIKITTNNALSPSVDTIFWTTGSANNNSVTSSVALGSFLLGNYFQQDIPNSGFDPIQLPCSIKEGDEIRFEYDENNTYKITNINYSSSAVGSPSLVYLTLDNVVPNSPSLNINHFTIRRKVKDSITGISLDANQTLPIQSGFLLPEYPSETIKKNLSNIINNLYNKTLI